MSPSWRKTCPRRPRFPADARTVFMTRRPGAQAGRAGRAARVLSCCSPVTRIRAAPGTCGRERIVPFPPGERFGREMPIRRGHVPQQGPGGPAGHGAGTAPPVADVDCLDHRPGPDGPGRPVQHVFSPERGAVSMVAETELSGGRIEVGMVGRESMLGLPTMLGPEAQSFDRARVCRCRARRIAWKRTRRAKP